MMFKKLFCLLIAIVFCTSVFAQSSKFKMLALYTTTVESDHVDFANDAIKYFTDLAAKDGFAFEATINWKDLNDDNLKNYQLIIWLNDFPQNEEQRAAFVKYMDNGGAWIGFHVAGYNDKYTKWPWFVSFLGSAVFYNNSWPPLPAKLVVDDSKHAVTKGIPAHFVSPINEWYGWKPSPRLNKDIKVLVTLDPGNYPLGKKDIIRESDIPVVWTNTKYKMLYINMGHGDQIFTSDTQNKLFENAVLWLGRE
ncbi:ThuA domain-containing protein [Mucilaginibacter sp. RCC_168]|uniref:ThuA domain-containing protein n=1 Tax=Mucilaginibacter sp. RCC_168 TaxID=3239221 RepID=UPI003524DE30